MSGVPAVKPKSTQADAVSLLFAGALCLLPFLLPYREPPILSFHAEWLAAALGVAAMLAGLRGRKGAFAAVPVPARWLIAFALFLAARTLVGAPVYPQLPLMAALYVVYGALLVWLGEVWTSPHNLPLQLLAETGALGAILALSGLGSWCWRAGLRYFTAPEPAMWWIIAAAGIELIHSMFEFPLWNAHFLGVTALVMGLGTSPGARANSASRLSRTAAVGICTVIALALALLLRDYLRLDETYVTGTTITLASPADASRDAAVMRAVARGPLAPTAELWIFLGAPLDRSDLASKLEMSARVARYFPSNAVIVRRAAFLALDGHAAAARSLLAHAMQSFPHRCKATLLILGQAPPSERITMEPLLNLAKDARKADCS